MSLRAFVHHWCVLATALSLMLPAAAAAQQATKEYDVEGIYLKAYMLVQDAEKLENQANFAGAYFKYKESSDILDSVARGYPNWRPTMVSFRRNLVRKKMEETKQRERDRRNTAAGASPGQPGKRLRNCCRVLKRPTLHFPSPRGHRRPPPSAPQFLPAPGPPPSKANSDPSRKGSPGSRVKATTCSGSCRRARRNSSRSDRIS